MILTSFLKTLRENMAASIGGSILAFLGVLWSLHSEEIYRRLFSALEEKGILAVLFTLLAACVWLALGWHQEKKNAKPIWDRLTPVRGGGYSRDPVTGEIACPKCVSEGRLGFMKAQRDSYYCYVCSIGVKKVDESR
jgi:hypothetical protein